MSFPTSPERHAQIVRLRPEKADEYLDLHERVWPRIEQRLREAHIRNYTIFRHGDLLIAYFEYIGIDFDADMESMAADPVVQEWWTHTDPCQESIEGAEGGRLWADAAQIWRLGETEEST